MAFLSSPLIINPLILWKIRRHQVSSFTFDPLNFPRIRHGQMGFSIKWSFFVNRMETKITGSGMEFIEIEKLWARHGSIYRVTWITTK